MKTVSITTYKSFLDELKIAVEEQLWTTVRDTTSNGIRELIVKSPNDAVCGFKEYTNNSTYYNILINYANTFDNSKSFFDQPGSIFNYPDNSSDTSNRCPVLNLHNNSMNCFFFVNVNRIVIVVNALSRYVSAYVGRYLRYGTALQIPNNLFAGASCRDTQETILNSTSLLNFMFYKSPSACASVVKNELSENIKIFSGGGMVFPFSHYENSSTIDVKDRNNNHILTPSILFSNTYALGELDGVYALGSVNGLTAENVLTLDDVSYKVFININKTTNAADFFAVKI